MRESVRRFFLPFTVPLEGVVPWLYQDVKGLVSIGIGNLVDPMSLALGLPLVHTDGRRATREEIAAEWTRIKNQPPDEKGRTAAMLGHLYAKKIATLRLTEDGIKQLVEGKLASNEVVLKRCFREFDEWPADAQLATLSMAWAVGPAFWSPSAGRNYWPKLTAALKARDFRTAANECFMAEEKTISGLRPRNRANRILYTNAAIAQHHLDPDVLFYPTELENVSEPTVEVEVPEMRPSPFEAQIIHPLVPLGRPALDGELPTTKDDDEPPPAAA